MRFIRAYIEQIKRLWVALSGSARLALLLLVVLVAVTLVWLVAVIGARPHSVAVFNTTLSDEQSGAAQQLLHREKIDVTLVNGLLMVPSERRDDAIALLASQSILPADPASELDSQVRQSSMWRTEPENQRLWQQLRQEQLSRWIAKFPGVRTAQVILEPGHARQLGTPAVTPTASVCLTLKPGGSMSRQLVKAIAEQVSGCVGSMKSSDVRIVADGRPYRAKDEQAADGEMMELVAEQERRFETKIQDLLRIDGLLVGVYVEPDPVRTRHTEETKYQEPVQAPANKVTEESTQTARRTAAEPGVMTNTGTPRIAANTGGESSMEKTETATDSRFPFKHTIEEAVGCFVKSVSVSVNVPRDYLLAAVKKIKGDKVEPSEAEVAAELSKIDDLVRGLIKAPPADPARPDNQVVVKYYVGAPAVAAQEVAYAGVHLAFGSYGKEAVLAGLAVLALVMVLMFARRRAPSPPLLEPPTMEEKISLEDAVGAIEGQEGALEGLELDDEAVRFQKVVEQIGEMVREKPDAASNLIQRWIDAK